MIAAIKKLICIYCESEVNEEFPACCGEVGHVKKELK